MALTLIQQVLSQQSEMCLDDRHLIIALHMCLGHSVDVIAEQTGYRKLLISKTMADLEAEGFIRDLNIVYALPTNIEEAPAPIQTASRDSLASKINNTINATTPKKRRKAAPKRPPRKTANTQMLPTEVPPAQWAVSHLLKYFEIRWFEQNWKTPLPSWKAKDRANAKRILEDFGAGSKDLVDYLFDNYAQLRSQLNLTSLPTMGVLWGFRSSIAPMALGDVTHSSNTKGWGSSHDSSQERNDGDEMGW